ncbi:MAG: ferrous iron transport protein B [Clostridium sp.]|nr:ferrous iron transport protein B [Clostridium sp.]
MKTTNLAALPQGEPAVITQIQGTGAFRARLGEMGFTKGQSIRQLFTAPTGDPIVFEIMDSHIALRREEARNITVNLSAQTTEETIAGHSEDPVKAHTQHLHDKPAHPIRPRETHASLCSCSGTSSTTKKADDELTLALVGNPNCGKTSLFNAASGGHEHTGNYSGVTVRSIIGHITFEGRKLRIIDLPGTYSLRAFSPEEAYVDHELEEGDIDAVINVIDATNLQRNLLLTLQLKERKQPLVGALNMYDELESSGSHLDIKELEQRLQMPFIPTVARQKKGINALLREAIRMADEHHGAHHIHAENPHSAGTHCAHPEHCSCDHTSTDAQGKTIRQCPCPEREKEDEARYRSISRLLQGIYIRKHGPTDHITRTLDKWLNNRWLAYPLFLLLMWLIFWATFVLGEYPMNLIDEGVAALGDLLKTHMEEGVLADLLIDGILAGVGSVIVFLPNILILYFFISLLEDSGYLARAAMLADPFLRRTGLHGKSFIPLLMGFGCNVPAVMATRTIENYKSRLITMLVTPLMSCSARMPVYIVFTGAFFARQAGNVLFILYTLGIITALIAAWLMSKVFLRDQESHFVMELPPYRFPALRNTFRHTWEKGHQYLHKMSTIILMASIVIWALGYFPVNHDETLTPTQQQEQSYLGRIGHAAEPILHPLGYDWRMGMGILAGVGAKELMVSTLSVLYNCSEDDAEAESAEDASQTRLAQTLRQHTTPAAAISFLVFALLYFPCMATISAIIGESGSWKWGLFTIVYTTSLAYAIAFVVYRLALLF